VLVTYHAIHLFIVLGFAVGIPMAILLFFPRLNPLVGCLSGLFILLVGWFIIYLYMGL
jgi:divalent metal cation (Fe/Co/Zn/Cd) transporter